MRHSTIKLTGDLYGKLSKEDIAEEVWALPALSIPTGGQLLKLELIGR